MTDSRIAGSDLLLKQCGCLRPEESVAIICDPGTREPAELLASRARRITRAVTLIEVPPLDMHGQEPPAEAASAMSASDLCLGITSKSMAHTQARHAAAARGMRYLSLPDYSMDLLGDSSLRADYKARGRLAQAVADAFTQGETVRVTSKAGTDITMRIAGRTGNCCPGYVDGPGTLGSPPDIESNVSPIENSAEGTVVVDGSVPYPAIGLLKQPLVLTVRGGSLTDLQGEPQTVRKLRELFAQAASPKAYVLAECGVGLNDRAALRGVMLTDEGAAGTMHFGFGSNSTVGGTNNVAFHLDFVFQNPTLEVDGCALLEFGALTSAVTRERAPS